MVQLPVLYIEPVMDGSSLSNKAHREHLLQETNIIHKKAQQQSNEEHFNYKGEWAYA